MGVRTVYQYAEDEVRRAESPGERQVLLNELMRYKNNTDYGVKTKNPNKVLRSTSPKLAKRALKKRYDDLFDNLIEYFTEGKEEDILSPHTLKDIIIGDLAEKRNLSRLKSEPFADALVNSERGKEWLLQHNVMRVRKQMKETESFVRPERREAFRKKVEDGNEVWRVLNERTNTVQVVYKTFVTRKTGEKQVRYRDINTGRYGANPQRVKEKILLEK